MKKSSCTFGYASRRFSLVNSSAIFEPDDFTKRCHNTLFSGLTCNVRKFGSVVQEARQKFALPGNLPPKQMGNMDTDV